MTHQEGRFSGQVALVTGSAHGIGEAIARRFADEGAAVVIADLDEAGALLTAKDIDAAGGRAIGVGVDVGKTDSVTAMVDRALEVFGRSTSWSTMQATSRLTSTSSRPTKPGGTTSSTPI